MGIILTDAVKSGVGKATKMSGRQGGNPERCRSEISVQVSLSFH